MGTIKVPCERGCARAEEIGYGICKRCSKSVEQEEPVKDVLSDEDLIKMAEDSRETIYARLDSLDNHHKLLVLSYIGGEMKVRNLNVLTPAGRAASIFLIAEAMVMMVPEEHRPWMKAV